MKQPGSSSENALCDSEAVERARGGDHEAFRVLVERHRDRVYRQALRILRDEELARDAVQEAFLKAYRGLRRFEGRSRFTTWLYRLVYNLCLDMKRRDRFSARQVEWDDERPASLPEDAPGRMEGPGAAAERVELRRGLAEAIDQLPDEARETLVLREVEGLSYAEIAEALRIPKGTVMSRLHYARRRVQAALERSGVVEGARDEAERSPARRGRR
jgi:RNA polymerase sigma-70 factor (ECF subfamily)